VVKSVSIWGAFLYSPLRYTYLKTGKLVQEIQGSGRRGQIVPDALQEALHRSPTARMWLERHAEIYFAA
jgi:hypothetical protein